MFMNKMCDIINYKLYFPYSFFNDYDKTRNE